MQKTLIRNGSELVTFEADYTLPEKKVDLDFFKSLSQYDYCFIWVNHLIDTNSGTFFPQYKGKI